MTGPCNTAAGDSALFCESIAERLNRECQCLNIDRAALHAQLERVFGESQIPGGLLAQHPHLFADFGVFATQWQVDRMRQIIQAVRCVIAMPAYQEAVLARSPAIARHRSGALGVFYGYDFHLSENGPHLLEINTNAGGAMLNAVLAKAQLACCDAVRDMMNGPIPTAQLDDALFSMFAAEWQACGKAAGRPLRTVAIVDTQPQEQYLYPEFLLFQDLFHRHGVDAVITDPAQLQMREGALYFGDVKIDLVYNRLTDFAFALPQHQALHEAYLCDAAVITPHPNAHALHADKRNLTILTDADLLQSWSVPQPLIDILLQGIPRTVEVHAGNADALWADRRRLFFKPAHGFGSRAVYRGDKLTRRVWEEILAGEYVAQTLIVPSQRRLVVNSDAVDLKLDVRCYVYDDEIQLLAARMYQGQVTNFRTAGGGFAPLYVVPCIPAAVT